MDSVSSAVANRIIGSNSEQMTDTLLPCGNEAEVIIVNDGSSDDTAKIAHKYAAQYPDIVRVEQTHRQGNGS